MAEWLKRGRDAAQQTETDKRVRETVEGILADIACRGDDAVREYSRRSDGLDQKSFRLDPVEIEVCLAQLSKNSLDEIVFAQAQVRAFAEHQRSTLHDPEVETLPGVVLGHKNIPVGAAGCYVPGDNYPPLANALMSIKIAKIAGVPRVITPPRLCKAGLHRPLSRHSLYTMTGACDESFPYQWPPNKAPRTCKRLMQLFAFHPGVHT